MNDPLRQEGRPPAISRQAYLCFYGHPDSPFLAPRGVCWAGGKLLVSDTAQNRLLVWDGLPTQTHRPPDLVLGQLDELDTYRNAGGVHAGSLQYPSGVWTDGNRLLLADAWNHRVLLWHTFPQRDGQPADVVIGQADKCSGQPNRKGVGAAPDADTLYWPYGVCSDGQRIWIADTGNRRVLYYDRFPERDGQAADGIIGQRSFQDRDYDPAHPIWPYSVKVSVQGALAIADPQGFRVCCWKHWRDALGGPPVLLGQEGLQELGQNRYHLRPGADTLNWCYDVCFWEHGLLVADTGNSRVLGFDGIPLLSGSSAREVLGSPDMQTMGEHLEAGLPHSSRLYWPFSLSADAGTLVVADTGNHRLVFYSY